MHPRQASVLNAASELADRIAAKKKQTEKKQQAGGKSGAPVLFKYTDPDSGQDFYLPEKKTTVKSPWSGKSISVKPEKFNMGDVGKELKEDAKAKKLWPVRTTPFWSTPWGTTRSSTGRRTSPTVRSLPP